MFLAGETYRVTVHWLAGGGGCGTCGESGTSPPTVVTVPGADPKSRVDLDRKLANAQCAKILEDRVIANVLPSMLSFTDGMKKYYAEQQARDLAASRYCRQIAADPIDRRFRSTVKLRKLPASRFKPASAGSAGKPLAAVLAAGGRLAVELEAVSASINRAQGATKARKKRFERKQMLSAAIHAKNASAAARALAAALPKAAAALQQSYPEIVGHVVSDQDLANARAQLAGGLPADQAAAFRRFGLPAAQIRQTGMIFNSTDTLGDVTLGSLMAGPDVIAMLKAEATAMRGLAAAWKRAPTGEL